MYCSQILRVRLTRGRGNPGPPLLDKHIGPGVDRGVPVEVLAEHGKAVAGELPQPSSRQPRVATDDFGQ